MVDLKEGKGSDVSGGNDGIDRGGSVASVHSDIADLSGFVHGDYVQAVEVPDGEEAVLKSDQISWVTAAIERGNNSSRLILESLKDSDEPIPDQEVILESALAGLTADQVDFMKQSEEAPFNFRIKPVFGSFERICELVDAQPATMGMNLSPQQQMLILPQAKKFLSSKFGKQSVKRISGYLWEFVQDQQIIKPFKGDRTDMNLAARRELFKRTLPKGMRGTDSSTWAGLAAEGLRNGTPLDCKFWHDKKDVPQCVERNFTVLDEEDILKIFDQRLRYNVDLMIGGYFHVSERRVCLFAVSAEEKNVMARFRASVCGPIRSQSVM